MAAGRHSKIPWWRKQSVRIRGYVAATAIVAIAVGRGWIRPNEVDPIIVILAALLGVWGIETSAADTVPKDIADQRAKQAEYQAERRLTGRLPVQEEPGAFDEDSETHRP